MALKDDVRGFASELEDVASRAGETVLDQGLGALVTEIHDVSVRLNELAENADWTAAAEKVWQHVTTDESDEDEVLSDEDLWEADNLPLGAHVGRESMDGESLKVGDRVQVYESGRYGDPTAVVKGAGPNYGDGKARVHVALEDGRDDRYTPSTGRVRKLPPGENKGRIVSATPEATVEVDGREFVVLTTIRAA